jgi:hypothetical protein
VARRIDELLDFVPRSARDFSSTVPGALAGLEAASWSL